MGPQFNDQENEDYFGHSDPVEDFEFTLTGRIWDIGDEENIDRSEPLAYSEDPAESTRFEAIEDPNSQNIEVVNFALSKSHMRTRYQRKKQSVCMIFYVERFSMSWRNVSRRMRCSRTLSSH